MTYVDVEQLAGAPEVVLPRAAMYGIVPLARDITYVDVGWPTDVDGRGAMEAPASTRRADHGVGARPDEPVPAGGRLDDEALDGEASVDEGGTSGRPSPDSTITSLTRGSDALALNTAVSGGLGLVFWVVAARVMDPELVGRDGALLNLATILAITGSTAFAISTSVLMPRSANPRRLLVQAYGACVAYGVVVAAVFCVLPLGSDFDTLREPTTALVFMCFTAAWGVFTLQDSVLVVCRKAMLVPLENAVFGIAKLIALIALAGAATNHAILTATLLPVLPIIVIINVVVLRALPAAGSPGAAADGGLGTIEQVRWWDHRRLLLGEMASSAASQMQVALLPVVVVAAAGARDGGFFYVAFMLGSQLALFAVGAAGPFIVEASRQPERERELALVTLWRATVLTVVLVGSLLLVAPFVMAVYGAEYAEESVAALRLVALSTLSSPITLVYTGIGRARRRPARGLVVSAVSGSGALGLAALLAPEHGAAGAGLGVLLGLWIPALVVAPLLARDLGWSPRWTPMWPGVAPTPLPFMVRRGEPIGALAAATLLSGLALPLVVAFELPVVLAALVIAPAALLLPGLLLAGVIGPPIQDWDDSRWALVVGASLAVWVLVAQLLLELDLWSPAAMAWVPAVATLTKLAVWVSAPAPPVTTGLAHHHDRGMR
ncbi:MAG: hypothetical protein S0880_11720 [Actinomycetota bacterium]|nr:hypothetical protein [Actinomycetota bacterium]